MERNPVLRVAVLALMALWLAGCDGAGPAAKRPVPALLPAAEREQARLLPFDGAHNFRELGGYAAADGRRVRWGVLYRSDALGDLSEEDQHYLARLGLRTVMDFRSDPERAEKPDRLPPEAGIRYVENPVQVEGTAVADLSRRIRSGDLGDTDFRALLIEGNRHFVTDQSATFGRFLRELADPGKLPMAFHCTGGKDRAGFAAALALLAVGVPRETVVEDFLRTNEYTADYIERNLLVIRAVSLFRTDPDRIRPLLGVERGYIEAALETIDREYGGVDAYLRQGLGLDDATLEALRANLLEG